MCQNCGNNPSSQGCYKHSTEGSDLNVYLIVVTFGIYGKKKNPIISYSHPGPIGDFCKNCKKTRDSSGCNSEVETSFLESSETIYTGCKFERRPRHSRRPRLSFTYLTHQLSAIQKLYY